MATAIKIRPLAVVTGASSGIGFELARLFAKNGYDLLVVAEDPGISEAGDRIDGENTGASVERLQADLTTSEGIDAAIGAIESAQQPVGALALNAGVGVGGEFVRTSLSAEIEMIKLNCISTIALAKRVLPMMIARREGRVLITSSIAATMPAPFEAVYGATKAFVLSFAEAIRNELKDTGVTVTAFQPGPTETNFFHRAGLDDTKVGQQKKDDPALVAKQGFEAMMAGKDKVYAGSLRTRLQGMMTELLPEPMKAERHRRLAEPSTGRRR